MDSINTKTGILELRGGGVVYSSLWVECKQLKNSFSYRQRKEENCCSWSSKQEGIFGFKI